MTALVTGGGGFLGGAVVRALLARGEPVRSFSRATYPALAALDVAHVAGDLADPAAVTRAVAGCDVVYHCAARAGVGGPWRAYAEPNIRGTAHVIRACRAAGVTRLVHTSTASVVHAGRHIRGGDERLPYAPRFEAAYPATKAVAERMVLAANGPLLATVALRPHLVWGPGDTHLVPGLLARARSGRLVLVSGGRAVVDTTYIDNAAAAHLLAADRLAPGSPVAGGVYFVAQGERVSVADLVARILAAAGLPPPRRGVPFPVAYAAGAVAEAAWRLGGRTDDPPITRFLARQLATDHWFDLSAARRDLGYAPTVSLDEGLARLAASLGRG